MEEEETYIKGNKTSSSSQDKNTENNLNSKGPNDCPKIDLVRSS